MKKLLAIALLFSFSTYTDARTPVIYQLDRGDGIRVRCINDFVFIETVEGAITQMWLNGNTPMRCQAYKNVKAQLNK